MKILRPICAGLDVHKNVIVATLGITDMNTQITQYLQESFSTLNCDLYRLRDWLLDHHCHDVCMESTGKYWIPVFNILEDNLHVFLTHPKYVKAIKGKKLSLIHISETTRLRRISSAVFCLKKNKEKQRSLCKFYKQQRYRNT